MKMCPIVYVLGDTPGYKAMNRYISQNWTSVVQPDIYMHEEGYLQCDFKVRRICRKSCILGYIT